MTFLKKLGSIIATVSSAFLGFAPVIGQQFPGAKEYTDVVSKDLAEAGNVIAEVEALGQLKGLSGPDKAALAGKLLAPIFLSSTLLTGKKIANPALLQQGLTEVGGGLADILNSVHADSTDTVSQKIPS